MSIKALNDTGRIGGYLVRFTGPEDRDLDGEYFTKETYLGLDWPLDARPALYHHGGDDGVKNEAIGLIDTLTKDDTGVWAEAQLDMSNQYWQAIAGLIATGRLGWSSGALGRVEVDGDGKILAWPIGEGSLTPTPADPRNLTASLKHKTNVSALRGAYKAHNIAWPVEAGEATAPGEDGRELVQGVITTDGRQWQTLDGGKTYQRKETIMDENMVQSQIAQAVADALAAEKAAVAQDALEAKAARVDELQEELDALKAAQPAQPAKRLPGNTEHPEHKAAIDIEVSSKYDYLDAADMSYAYAFLRGHKSFNGASEMFWNAFAHKFSKLDVEQRPDYKGKRIKADEVGYSTLASYGDEWVPNLWTNELWPRARLENQILSQFNVTEMPSNPFTLPIESTDPTVSFVPETTDESQLTISGSGNPIPDSLIGTGNVTLTAGKLALRVGFSSELVEDSIIPFIPQARAKAMRAIMDAIDHVLLNGDDTNTATGNINLDDADPPDTSKYLIFNGLRHLPLVTTTANAIDATGAPTLDSMRQTRFTMAGKYSVRPDRLIWIVDAATYAKLLSLDEFVTMDKAGAQATNVTGQMKSVDGIPVIASAEMGLTEADGKISTTAGNNTKGQAVLVYTPGWQVGFRRRVAADVSYIPYVDAYQMTATVRLAFINFDADVAACLYNITV